MNDVLGHDSVVKLYTEPQTTWANEMNMFLKHALGAGSIVLTVDKHPSSLPLCYRCPYEKKRWTTATGRAIDHVPGA